MWCVRSKRPVHSSGGTAAASRMASELEDMCALSTTCAHKNPQKKKKRTGTKTGAVCHAVARSSVERALRCVRIMHLVCCLGESVCAASHLLYVLPCRAAAGYATPAVRPPKKKPEMHLLAKRCKDMCGGPTKNKIDRGFLNCWSHHRGNPKRAFWWIKNLLHLHDTEELNPIHLKSKSKVPVRVDPACGTRRACLGRQGSLDAKQTLRAPPTGQLMREQAPAAWLLASGPRSSSRSSSPRTCMRHRACGCATIAIHSGEAASRSQRQRGVGMWAGIPSRMLHQSLVPSDPRARLPCSGVSD